MDNTNKDYQLENMARIHETLEIYDNLKSNRGTIGYHALSFAVKASQQRDELLLGKALDLARDYTSYNGMMMPNNLPAELYLNMTLDNFERRKRSHEKEELVRKWKTMGTIKRANHLNTKNY